MSYYIGVPCLAGSIYWTGTGYSTARADARPYRTIGGALRGIRAAEKANPGRYFAVVGDSDLPDYYAADGTDSAQWVDYCRRCRAQLAANFPGYHNPY